MSVRITCGIDWAEDHHDVALVDQDGVQVAKRRISDDAAGFTALLQLLAEQGDTSDEPIPVAIETSRGLLVAALHATGRPVYAINPLAVSRYRDRHSAAGKKSDAGDARVLAHILRTDAASHRRLPADSELARSIRVLARAQQDSVWDRTSIQLRIRSLLREFYPAALHAIAPVEDGLASRLARALLAAAPTPARGAALSLAQLRQVLRRAGRRRNVDTEADRLRQVLRAEQLRQPMLIEHAMGEHLLALLQLFEAACSNSQALEAAANEAFTAHPDADIITSFPGVGTLLGARILGEIGDDRNRFADARALKAYAGASPVTRASGRTRVVFNRRVKNQRLASTGYRWAFSSLTASPGARAHYDRRRALGEPHTAAQRNLFNRMLGMLHHCLATGQHYREDTAYPRARNTVDRRLNHEPGGSAPDPRPSKERTP